MMNSLLSNISALSHSNIQPYMPCFHKYKSKVAVYYLSLETHILSFKKNDIFLLMIIFCRIDL